MTQPIDVGTRAQLFIDHRFIDRKHNLQLNVNPPEKLSEPVIKCDRPWEKFGITYHSVVEEDGLFRMWYQAVPKPFWWTDESRICYAESNDGKTWSKPQVITNNAEVHVYLTQLRDGRILATYTNYHLPFGTYAIVSSDGGHTWDRDHPIQLAVSALNQSGWPVTLQLADDSLITAYATTAYLHQTRKFATEVVRWKMP